MASAREAGFNEKDGTLGEMYQVIRESDMVVLLKSGQGRSDGFKNAGRAHARTDTHGHQSVFAAPALQFMQG